MATKIPSEDGVARIASRGLDIAGASTKTHSERLKPSLSLYSIAKVI